PSLQVDHPHAIGSTGSLCEKGISSQSGYRFYFLERQQGCLHLIHHIGSSVYSGSRRSGDVDIDHALIFIRNEACRHDRKHPRSKDKENYQGSVGPCPPAGNTPQYLCVSSSQLIVPCIEAVEKTLHQASFLP